MTKEQVYIMGLAAAEGKTDELNAAREEFKKFIAEHGDIMKVAVLFEAIDFQLEF